MAWVIDLDGVLWRGSETVPGAVDAACRLVRAGPPVAFVTNNSSIPASEVADHLAKLGVDPDASVLTSAGAAATLVGPGDRVMVRGGPGVVQAVTDAGAQVVETAPIEAVVVGWHRDFTYDSLAEAHTAIAGGARFLATNDDATYPIEGGAIPGGGAIVAYLERSTGVAPVIAGKPHTTMADLISDQLGSSGWVVGDRPETDGLLARRLGWRFALVLTGVTAAEDVGDPAPDLVAADLAAVVDTLLPGEAGQEGR